MEYFIIILLMLKTLTVALSAIMIHFSMKYKKCRGIDLRKVRKNDEKLGTSRDAKLIGYTIHAVKYSLN